MPLPSFCRPFTFGEGDNRQGLRKEEREEKKMAMEVEQVSKEYLLIELMNRGMTLEELEARIRESQRRIWALQEAAENFRLEELKLVRAAAANKKGA